MPVKSLDGQLFVQVFDDDEKKSTSALLKDVVQVGTIRLCTHWKRIIQRLAISCAMRDLCVV